MPEQGEREPTYDEHNLVASFPDQDEAQKAESDVQREAGGDAARVRQGSRQDEIASRRAEMREELDQSFAGPAVGVANKEQAKGGLAGTVVGGAAGVALGVVLGLVIPMGDWPVIARVLAWAVVGALAGSTAGVLLGGKLGPESKGTGETLSAERGPTLSVSTDDAGRAEEAARRLKESGAERVDRVGREGQPEGRLD